MGIIKEEEENGQFDSKKNAYIVALSNDHMGRQAEIQWEQKHPILGQFWSLLHLTLCVLA